MTRSKLFVPALLAGMLLAASAIAEDKKPAAPYAMPGMTPAMSAMMNPMMYNNMMGYMMNPMPLMSNPTASCSQCHTAEDVSRYQKTMGPMLAMMNPGNWMNPNAYMSMMTPMMDPKMYTEWYNAMMKKYGAAAGAATGTGK